jgi:hypothetical protein
MIHNNTTLKRIIDSEMFYFCVSVVTSYFNEDVLFSVEDLHRRNEDGISILFYLRKIFPGNLCIHYGSRLTALVNFTIMK